MNTKEHAAKIFDNITPGTFQIVRLELVDPFGTAVFSARFHDPDPGMGTLLRAYHRDTDGVKIPVPIGPNGALPHFLYLGT